MKQSDRLRIERLLKLCRMFLYACGGSPECRVNAVADDLFQFALLHVTSTMFITEEGVFHRILNPMRHQALLAGVDAALDSRVGKTTLRQFIRSKRNKLATHGDLSFSSQPREVRNVTFSPRALQQFEAAMYSLESAVRALSRGLEAMTKRTKNVRPQDG